MPDNVQTIISKKLSVELKQSPGLSEALDIAPRQKSSATFIGQYSKFKSKSFA